MKITKRQLKRMIRGLIKESGYDPSGYHNTPKPAIIQDDGLIYSPVPLEFDKLGGLEAKDSGGQYYSVPPEAVYELRGEEKDMVADQPGSFVYEVDMQLIDRI
jgi:hypothetical protein